MTNYRNKVLYTGITSDLIKRVYQHKNGKGSFFTSKYKCYKLVYFEEYLDSITAIEREKQIKAGSRQKKIDLITNMNPKWEDLYKLIID